MRTIARRTVLSAGACALSAFLCARRASPAASETPLDRLAKLAGYLSRNDVPQAIGCFDPTTKDYGTIEADIAALGAQTDVLCAIDIVTESGSGDARTLDTDWFVELRSQADGGPVERRRERVQVVMKKSGDKWKITALSPESILAPIAIR